MSARTWILSALALLVAVPVASGAPPSVAYYYPAHRHHRRPVVVVRPAPPPVVVVEQPPARTVVVRPAPPRRRQAPRRPAQPTGPLSIGVRVGGMNMSGYRLHLSDLENPVLGGVGVQFRSRFDDHWGIEVAADFLAGGREDFRQYEVPITLSLTGHLFPNSRVQPYGVAGIGLQFTRLEYLGGAFERQLTQFTGHIGAGAEVFVSRRLSLQADLRFIGLFKDLGSRQDLLDACRSAAGASSPLCLAAAKVDTNDRFDPGLQFLVGLNYRF